MLKALFCLSGSAVAVLGILVHQVAFAADPEGHELEAIPAGVATIEEQFQVRIVAEGLRRLGYRVPAVSEANYPQAHKAVADGHAHWSANHWDPLHQPFFDAVGGERSIVRAGNLVKDSIQGYLIDRKTAEEYNITDLSQLRDPRIATLFDIDGDGKSDLTGCNVGWGCALEIKRHIAEQGLGAAIVQKQGDYFTMMMDVVARYNAGKPILYYAWTPLWVSAVLVPGKDSRWLTVGGGSTERTLSPAPGAIDTGFAVNTQMILANKRWLEQNPAAERFFSQVAIDAAEISSQNMRMRSGESSSEDIDRHVQHWIRTHEKEFNAWIEAASKTAS
ncbi:glycine betaine/L-proline ABC transporter substrate-binding protein ProX [Haematospirillum sp. H1815]|uniref:glycine betaine/L-proline ABC transporter substrate-binding protein ProX n=1 Tax=Haematospirillum sp. H1815 TaxID=2723108 RepID=UPI001439BF1B|nr:glycine betaine/L-proline ABC transporter substrate-binding protein ProX [Haematospirillum sp. H1815]NKD77488.1 glycine betaine/L-proline ABC transporter substrate-binding protein ProX [Haematospirillum sp. H1815]